MLWWGVDEMLAQLFAHLPDSSGFEGNPMGRFTAQIEGERFGLNQTPAKLGLFGGQYTIVFRPGEFLACACVVNDGLD